MQLHSCPSEIVMTRNHSVQIALDVKPEQTRTLRFIYKTGKVSCSCAARILIKPDEFVAKFILSRNVCSWIQRNFPEVPSTQRAAERKNNVQKFSARFLMILSVSGELLTVIKIEIVIKNRKHDKNFMNYTTNNFEDLKQNSCL